MSVKKTKTKKVEMRELDKSLMLNDYINGMTIADISKKYNTPYRTLMRYSTEEDWKTRKDLVRAGVEETSLVSDDILRNQAITKTLRVLHKIASDTELNLFGGNPTDLRVNIKTLVDAIDKIARLQMHVESGGVEKKQVDVRKQTLDWNKLIETSVKAKKEKGDSFNEKDFIKNVIEAEIKK